MIRPVKSKDLQNFIYFCKTRDEFSDFYITKNNKRLFLSNTEIAKQVFKECTKYANKCYIKEDNGEIKAVLLVLGFKDHFERKYIKILAKTKKDFEDLFTYLQWQKISNLFAKVKNTNTNFVKFDKKINRYKPSYILRKNGFRVIAVREKEVLLKKEDNNRGYHKHNNKRS